MRAEALTALDRRAVDAAGEDRDADLADAVAVARIDLERRDRRRTALVAEERDHLRAVARLARSASPGRPPTHSTSVSCQRKCGPTAGATVPKASGFVVAGVNVPPRQPFGLQAMPPQSGSLTFSA